jgi:hypothetical protein
MARMPLEDITIKLTAAKAEGKIWNVDYVAIKDALGRHFDDVDTAVRDAVHTTMSREIAWDLTSDFICSNYSNFAGRVARLEKRLMAAPEALAAVKPLVRPFLEIIPLVVAVKPLIVKGRKPSENPSANARTIDHTGTCGCCMRNIKMTENGHMWDHGYQVEGRGYGYGQKVGGSCFGVGYKPIEVSCQVWKDMQEGMEHDLANLPDRITNLTKVLKGKVKVDKASWLLTPEEKAANESYTNTAQALSHAKHCLKSYPHSIETLKVSIANWAPKPLPGTK